MLKSFITLGVVVAALTFEHTPGVRAAAGQAAAPAQTSRPLFDQYCVSCHNDRLKTGDLVARQASTRLTSRQQCRHAREGRPQAAQRPDAAGRVGRVPTRRRSTRSSRRSRPRSIAHAAAAPNPGRVASRRLNRAEYVNVDPRPARPRGEWRRAAAERHGRLRVRQQRRRAVDHAGADGALHRRRRPRSAALALASPDNRPVTQVYKVELRDAAGRADGRGHAVRARTAASRSGTPSRSTASTRSSCG